MVRERLKYPSSTMLQSVNFQSCFFIGPIIRISPYELHVIDPSFAEKLYRQDGRWDKYAWTQDAFGVPGASLCTVDHDVHRARRRPLDSFFSKPKVVTQEPLIQRNVDMLCKRLSEIPEGTRVNLGAAISAFTRDAATEFIINKSYDNLGQEDFNVSMTNVFQNAGYIARVTRHVRWFGPSLRSIPTSWMMKIADEGAKALFRYQLVISPGLLHYFFADMEALEKCERHSRNPSSRKLRPRPHRTTYYRPRNPGL